MCDENSVIFKGKKDRIVVVLDGSLDFEKLKTVFRDKISNAKKFLGYSDTSISFQGRELTENEENQLLEIISEESGLRISFVSTEDDINKKNVILKKEETKNIEKSEEKIEFSVLENLTKYHKGSLRSGQSLKYSGSVVIIGDVNPGGEIIAEGNVTVLGNLKGLVHAGCTGNKECFVTAFNFEPTQLRIADIITYIPKEMSGKNNRKPSHAYIENGQIYIEPLL